MEILVLGFDEGSAIPRRFTCDGEDLSPQIKISGVPEEAKSLAIIMDDPDAPSGLFTHWIALNINPNTREIKEGSSTEFDSGRNDFGKQGYNGPCPPPGKPHRYYFTLYALKKTITGNNKRRNEINLLMDGNIISKCSYMGKYGRN